MDFTFVVALASFALIVVAFLAIAVYWLVRGISRLAADRQERRGRSSGLPGPAGSAPDAEAADGQTPGRRGLVAWLAGSHLPRGRVNPKRSRRARGDFDDEDDDALPGEVMALLAAISAASVIVDSEGKVLRCSPAAYRLGVVSNDSVVNAQVSQALATVFAQGGQQRFDLVTMTAPEYVDEAIADGLSITDEDDWLEERSAGPAGPGPRTAAAAQVGTVSRRNWLKVSVARLNGSQAVVLLDDVSAQERFKRVREAFVVNVSQQLLKPTRALERLGRELDSGHIDSDSLSHYATQVSRYSTDLNHLVSDLLLLLKAQQPVPQTADRVEVKPLVERVVARHVGQAGGRGVAIHAQVAAGLAVKGREDQLEGALAKLIENAVDYSPRGASVGVAAKLAADGQSVVIRVVDQGKGIPARDQPHIFERFWRGADQAGRDSHGTGLGLAVVKHVALAHHGSVSVWSAPGQGSTFSLTLPVAG